jgi:hypothetical protein
LYDRVRPNAFYLVRQHFEMPGRQPLEGATIRSLATQSGDYAAARRSLSGLEMLGRIDDLNQTILRSRF